MCIVVKKSNEPGRATGSLAEEQQQYILLDGSVTGYIQYWLLTNNKCETLDSILTIFDL